MSLIAELKRRNVFRVAIAYLIFAWLVLQIADVLFPAIGVPDWGISLVVALLAIGALPALIVSWVYELTPDGLKKASEVDQSRSITPETGRRLDIITIAMVVLAIAVIAADRFWLAPNAENSSYADRHRPAADAVQSDVPIVAVLPFKALGSDDGGFLAAGLHDDLLTRLARLDAFKVISRTSMMEYANTTKNMRQIGDELGAGYILEGGVQAMGDHVRINAQLIDAARDEHIWADTYDRELTAANLFAVQANLAVAIAGQLHTALSSSDRKMIDDVPTQNTAAYNAYLRGLELIDTGAFSASNNRAVVTAFEEAVGLDPAFAVAWARLSIARTRLAQLTDELDTRESAVDAMERARELQPGLPEAELAHVVYLYRSLSEYEQALEVLEALSTRANLGTPALLLKGWLLRRVGRFRDAYDTFREAQKIEPRSAQIAQGLVSSAVLSDDCESAGRHASAALSLAPDSVDLRAAVARFELECTGNAQRAGELLANVELESGWHRGTAILAAYSARDYVRLLELSGVDDESSNPLFRLLNRATALSGLGREAEASEVLDGAGQMLALAEVDQVDSKSSTHAAARGVYHAMRGEPDETADWVDKSTRRLRQETHDDKLSMSEDHFYAAWSLTVAGLHDEAIDELRIMFEEPGGYGFRFVDGFPDLDVLDDQPGYMELRERFADAR